MSFPWKRQQNPPAFPILPLPDPLGLISDAQSRLAADLAGSMRRGVMSAYALTAGPPAPAPAPFPHHSRDEPIAALKQAQVMLSGDSVLFGSLHHHGGGGSFATYGARDVARCYCACEEYSYLGMSLMGYPTPGPRHARPGRDTKCGFYAWSDTQPMPWEPGAWLLEVDLYGFVVRHQHGYRAQKQRVLSISPVVSLMCDAPSRLVLREGKIIGECPSCPEQPGDHPVSIGRLRQFLNVEVDMERAWKMREQAREAPVAA